MRTVLLMGLAALLAACGDPPAPPAAAPLEPVKKTAPAAVPLDEMPAPEAATPGIAVDEPLPPFEDDSGIILYAQGALRMSDSAQPVSGEVFIYEAPDGSRLLRLENVFSSKELRIDVAVQGETLRMIGPLKGPSGNMNYLLERGFDLSGTTSIALVESGSGRVLALAPIEKLR